MKSLPLSFARLFFEEEQLQKVQHLFPLTKDNYKDILSSGLVKDYEEEHQPVVFFDDSGKLNFFKGMKMVAVAESKWGLVRYPVTSIKACFTVAMDSNGMPTEVVAGNGKIRFKNHILEEGGHTVLCFNEHATKPFTRKYYDSLNRLVSEVRELKTIDCTYKGDSFIPSDVKEFKPYTLNK